MCTCVYMCVRKCVCCGACMCVGASLVTQTTSSQRSPLLAACRLRHVCTGPHRALLLATLHDDSRAAHPSSLLRLDTSLVCSPRPEARVYPRSDSQCSSPALPAVGAATGGLLGGPREAERESALLMLGAEDTKVQSCLLGTFCNTKIAF